MRACILRTGRSAEGRAERSSRPLVMRSEAFCVRPRSLRHERQQVDPDPAGAYGGRRLADLAARARQLVVQRGFEKRQKEGPGHESKLRRAA
jgi:hypothetical protein